MTTDTHNNDAVRELLCKRVRELEARNKALTDCVQFMLKDYAGLNDTEISKAYGLSYVHAVRKARALVAANAPAPVVERAPIGSLK